MNQQPSRRRITADNLRFAVYTFVAVLLAHAMAYLAHEYAHAVTAWALGWMAGPFDIDYGPATLYNFLFLNGVSDNVAYDPIYASGHGAQAAVIALAGAFIGNGVLYFISYRLAKTQLFQSSRWSLAFIYWFSLMSAANVWSYVPIRAITTHADIAIAAKGLDISTWTLLPFVLVPSLYITWHFFCRMFPTVCRQIAARSANNRALLIAVTGYWYFSFFGSDGLFGDYGLIPQILSIISRYFLFPLSVMYLWSKHSDAVEAFANAKKSPHVGRNP